MPKNTPKNTRKIPQQISRKLLKLCCDMGKFASQLIISSGFKSTKVKCIQVNLSEMDSTDYFLSRNRKINKKKNQ